MAVSTEPTGPLPQPGPRFPQQAPPTAHGNLPVAITAEPRARAGRRAQTRPAGGDLLLADLRVAFELINHARYEALARFLGVPREQANLATAVIGLMVAEAVHDQYRAVVKVPHAPAALDAVVGAAALRELLSEITGLPPEDTPVVGAVLTIATLASIARPALSGSARAAKDFSRRMDALFRGRYGYIVDPGHLRLRRAQRRGAR